MTDDATVPVKGDLYVWELHRAEAPGMLAYGPMLPTADQAMRHAEGHFLAGIGAVAMALAEAPMHPSDPLTPAGALDELPAEWAADHGWENCLTWTPRGWEWYYRVGRVRDLVDAIDGEY